MTANAADKINVCAECGGLLRPVGLKTVTHLLKYELARRLENGTFWYCPGPDCDIIYLRFSPDNASQTPDEVFRRDDIKEHARPHATGREKFVCYCFGYTVGEIEDDAAEGISAIPKAIAEEVRAGTCACEVMNPSGH